jgi:hypothetical protein
MADKAMLTAREFMLRAPQTITSILDLGFAGSIIQHANAKAVM